MDHTFHLNHVTIQYICEPMNGSGSGYLGRQREDRRQPTFRVITYNVHMMVCDYQDYIPYFSDLWHMHDRSNFLGAPHLSPQ